MKRIIELALVLVLAFSLPGCNSTASTNKSSPAAKPVSILAEDSYIESWFNDSLEAVTYYNGVELDYVTFYNESGEIIRREEFSSVFTDEPTLFYLEDYKFSSNGDLLSITEQCDSWPSSILTMKCEYDSYNNLTNVYHYTSRLYEEPNLIAEAIYDYYPNGILEEKTTIDYLWEYDDNDEFQIYGFFMKTLFYTESGNIETGLDTYATEDGEINKLHTYENDRLVESASFYGEETLIGFDYYSYDNAGRLLSKIYVSEPEQYVQDHSEYKYTADGQISFESVVYSDGSGHSIEYKYDEISNSRASRETTYTFNGVTNYVEYKTEQYDEHGNVILEITKDKDGNEYVSAINTYEYYENGNIKIKREYRTYDKYIDRIEPLVGLPEYFKF